MNYGGYKTPLGVVRSAQRLADQCGESIVIFAYPSQNTARYLFMHKRGFERASKPDETRIFTIAPNTIK